MNILAPLRRIFGQKTERIDAVVSGYFGYGNSGDDTALDCLVGAIRQEHPETVIAVLCRDPESFGKAHGIIGIGRYDLPAIASALRGASLLISGGGSLLQNVTSSRSLFYYAGVIALGKICGTKVFVCANGIGPLKGWIGRKVAYKAVMMADRVSVRDEASRDTLVGIGVPMERIAVTADPAFRLVHSDRCDVEFLRQRLGMRKGGRYFAVSLRASVCRGDRAREICRACRDIHLGLGLVPVFVSMQESEDAELCRMIAEESCGEALVMPNVPTEVLRSFICEMEMVLSMRLHLMIYAATVGTPAVGVSVDPKLSAVAGILGSAEIIGSDSFSAENILSAARRAVSADREELLRIAREQAESAGEDIRAAVGMILG